MTKDEISTLAHEGNEIGGHSVTHPLLTTVSPTQLTDELVTSKQVLEAIPGVGTVRNFAYPYGDYDARVIAAEQAAGYRSGRSVEEGYNSKLDLELYDIRVQNMTPDTTLAQYKSWIEYAKAHNYWLVIVYHEVVPDTAPRCQNTNADPDPCLGDFDTKVSAFQAQLDAISIGRPRLGRGDRAAGPGHRRRRDARPAWPARSRSRRRLSFTSATLTAAPSGFSDPDGDALSYQYQWKVNGVAIAGATAATFDLSAAGHGNAGDVISVDVSARDPQGHVSTGVSDSVTVANTAPVKGSVAVDPSTADRGDGADRHSHAIQRRRRRPTDVHLRLVPQRPADRRRHGEDAAGVRDRGGRHDPRRGARRRRPRRYDRGGDGDGQRGRGRQAAPARCRRGADHAREPDHERHVDRRPERVHRSRR